MFNKGEALLILALFVTLYAYAHGQNISDEARRHFDRGMAAVEMAKSPEDLNAAINEFRQATVLAPDWADAFFNLGKVQEAAEKFTEAIASYRQYLRLSPEAADADGVKSLINKIELKAEQVLSIPAIVDVLVEFGKPKEWNYSATVKTADRQCRQAWSELLLSREGSDTVRAMRSTQYYTGPKRNDISYTYQSLKVTGPVLQYVTTINVCDSSAHREFGDCTSVMENEVQVVSRTLVRVNQRVLRGGDGAGTVDGDVFACEFRKNVSAEAVAVDIDTIISNKERVASAIAAGTSVNAKNRDGNTMLQLAVRGGYIDVVDLLIANGADLKIQGNDGKFPLWHALRNTDLSIAKLLIAKGADIEQADKNGYTLLYGAISDNRKDVVELLIASGANIHAKDFLGLTPLHKASYDGHSEIAELLIAKGANVEARNNSGMTPLYWAVIGKQKNVAELLIAKGADVNATTDILTSILLAAVTQDSTLEICELLIRSGADTSVTSAGYSLLELAENYKRGDIATMLRNYKGGPYIEEFNRKSGWAEFQYSDGSAIVANGKYTFENNKVGYTWNVDKTILIDTSRDFSIETEMKFIGGVDGNFYGVLWGRKDVDNFFFFGVTSNGNYAYRKWLYGAWSEVIQYRPSAVIKKGVNTNKLSVRRRAATIEFYINDKLVNTAPFEDFAGKIGFHLNDVMKVEIEYLKVSYP